MRALLITLTAAAALAQHAATYDTTRTVRVQGAVTRIEWVNPRAFVFLDVRDPAGSVVNWAVEIGNPIELERSQWSARTVKIGDILTAEGSPARDASHRMIGGLTTAAGRKLFTDNRSSVLTRSTPTPRWPGGGHPRLGPAPGERGYWEAAPATQFVEKGVTVSMSDEGLLKNLSDVDKVAPFQPWAKALYEYRQRTLLADDPFHRCQPQGGPRQFQTENGVQFIEQPEIGRVLVLLGGGDRNWRAIYTGDRPVAHPEDVVLTYYGTSVGQWEGDTFIVDSVGFNESFWFAKGGLPHTDALHLTERFTRTDSNTLNYEVTIDDPKAYTRPWTAGWALRWVPDRDIEEFFCEENAESTFVR